MTTKRHVVQDVAFDSAEHVSAIQYRLHPLDVGFDLREQGMAVRIEPESRIRISYAARDHSRRVMSGPREDVLAQLRKLGYVFVSE